jgi:hypothetical protein
MSVLSTLSIATIVGLLAVAATAFADGTSAIAGAPTVTVGQQEFGNLANIPNPNPSGGSFICIYDWWLLPLTAGDQVTIQYNNTTNSSLIVEPAGTTDYTLDQTTPVLFMAANANGLAQETYTATRTGTYPLAIVDQDTSDDVCQISDVGPYNFTVHVIHQVELGQLRISHNGTASIGIHAPDGTPLGAPLKLSVQIKKQGSSWTTVSTAKASHGTAKFELRIPRRFLKVRVSLRVVATGANYKTIRSKIEVGDFTHSN